LLEELLPQDRNHVLKNLPVEIPIRYNKMCLRNSNTEQKYPDST